MEPEPLPAPAGADVLAMSGAESIRVFDLTKVDLDKAHWTQVRGILENEFGLEYENIDSARATLRQMQAEQRAAVGL